MAPELHWDVGAAAGAALSCCLHWGGLQGPVKAWGKPQLECLPFSFLGSRMGRWDRYMLLQTLSTSVPVMVSAILLPMGGQNPTVWFPSPLLSSESQRLTPQEAETRSLVHLS